MDRLTCNLRNVKRPIRGLFVGKTIVRDELGVEIPLRIYSRIKRDCNVFAVIDGKEYIIPTETEFKKLLLKADNNKARGLTKPIMYVADSKEEREILNVTEEPVSSIPHVYSAPNGVCLPHLMTEDENGTLVDTGIPVEESDGVITTASAEVPVEVTEEEPEAVEEDNNVEESTEETTANHQQNNRNRKNKNRR